MKKLTVLTGSERTQPKVSQGKNYPPTGLLSLIFCQFKVTASDSAEVTVSMTSEDSVGYANLSSPKRASAKYRQPQIPMLEVTATSSNTINGLAYTHMLGVFPDNLLNIKAESAFVQSPDIAQTLCVTNGNSQNQQYEATVCIPGVHSPKGHIASAIPEVCSALSLSFSSRPVQSNEIRCLEDVLVTKKKKGSIRSATLWHGEEVGQLWDSCLAPLRSRRLISPRIEVIMNCPVLSLGSFTSSIASITSCGTRDANCVDLLLLRPVAITSLRCFRWLALYSKKSRKKTLKWSPPCVKVVSTLIDSRLKMSMSRGATNTRGTFNQTVTGVNDMACSHDTQTRPKFLETYWIVPCYSTTPYGKVSLTRQDRRTFIAIFKDSRLIWAGREPVNGFTEYVKRTESQNVGVKHTMSPKECLKDPESQKVDVKRSVNPTSSVKETESCRGQSVSDIVTQGGVKITPPSTITNIVTVQGVAHV